MQNIRWALWAKAQGKRVIMRVGEKLLHYNWPATGMEHEEKLHVYLGNSGFLKIPASY